MATLIGHIGGTPLHSLLRRKYDRNDDVPIANALPIARYLVQAYPDCVTMQDNSGCTPLHHVCIQEKGGALPFIRLVVEVSEIPAALRRLVLHVYMVLPKVC